MTLNDITTQLYDLAVGGYFNREKFTKRRLRTVLACFLREEVGTRFTMEIALPDGWWLCEVTRGEHGYDYLIPDTREQEEVIWERIGH